MDVLPLQRWMTARGYRPSTNRKTASDVARAYGSWMEGGGVPKGTEPALRRFLAWWEDDSLPGDLGGVNHSTAGFVVWVQDAGVEACRARPGAPKRRAKVHRSWSDDDWRRLAQALVEDRTREGRVLFALACSGLRIGDVLPLTRRRIGEGLESGMLLVETKGGVVDAVPVGGVQDAWERLRNGMESDRQNVAEWLTGQRGASTLAADAAYQRVRRALKGVAAELGLDGRAHLHRLRRTVAVQALRLTGDVKRVQQLLGHRSMKSTEQYVDEVRKDDVADLQRQLGGFRGES